MLFSRQIVVAKKRLRQPEVGVPSSRSDEAPWRCNDSHQIGRYSDANWTRTGQERMRLDAKQKIVFFSFGRQFYLRFSRNEMARRSIEDANWHRVALAWR